MADEHRSLRRILRDALRDQLPAPARRRARRALADVRTVALSAAPLPLQDALRLRTASPDVGRVQSVPSETGWHFLLLAGIPMGDSGGGQRPAQLALELLARGHRVTYVHRFPSAESRRGPTFIHERLTHLPFERFSAGVFARSGGRAERLVTLVSYPLAEFLEAARFLKAERGATTVYDCLDDWDSSLGGNWYSPRAETALARESDVVVASAQLLVDLMKARGAREVALVPNAVNTGLFRLDVPLPRPSDLPEGRVFLYTGSLWGDWFDWGWTVALARANPDASVVLIGEFRGECPEPPSNLKFLGLKPQRELPAYLAHAAVCLIPFRLDRLVQAVSPLKVFEYLAMGRPVAGSAMKEIVGLPGVFTATTEQAFLEAVARAEASPPSPDAVARFREENGWSARVRQLERLLGAEGAAHSPHPAPRAT